ncbi:MAG: hypothetical protein IPK15_19075 [Verrucomicrobia bacterium]|nr:hypothetical protein [Verrucomicrobiota bacterium]
MLRRLQLHRLPTVHVLLYSNGVLVAERTGVTGQLGLPLFTLPDWPLTLGKLGGATPCRRGTIKLGTIRLPGGAGFGFGEPETLVAADEFRIIAELPPAPRTPTSTAPSNSSPTTAPPGASPNSPAPSSARPSPSSSSAAAAA